MTFKLRYFCVHLLFSIFAAILILSLVFFVWYPSPLDDALGVADIFLLVVGIDVVLGPMLTLFVVKQGKKTLKMDLLVIVIIQLAAFLYGAYIVAQGRPVWIVYDSGRFELVQAYEVIGGDERKILPAFRKLTYGAPIWGGVSSARYLEQDETLPLQDMYLRAEYLSDYKSVSEDVKRRVIPLAVLYRFNKNTQVDNILEKYPNADNFLPLQTNEKALVVLINKATAEPIAIVNLAPW